MPTYALLGATGATGSAVLRCLLDEPPTELTLNILIRSKAKLARLFPNLEETSTINLNIVEGTANNSKAMQQCLAGADAIMMCIATNESKPGESLSYDTAAVIIDSLRTLKQESKTSYRTPTLLMLRAGPVNTKFRAQMPRVLVAFIWFCLYFVYTDMANASQLYEEAAKDDPELLEYIYVDAGALQDPDGVERTGHRIFSDEDKFEDGLLSYADLGAAMCEVAIRREEFKGKGVGMLSRGKVKMTPGANLWFALDGLKNRVLWAVGLM